MTIENFDLNTIALARGSHARRDVGVCLLEAVAWMAGEPHSDRPSCADPVLAAFGRSINDRLRDDERQQLRPLIPLLVGTAGSPGLSMRRAYHLVDRHLRYVLPAFFRELPGKPRPDVTEKLEALDPVIDGASAKRARVLACEIRDQLAATAYAATATAADAAADAAFAAANAAADAAYAASDAASDAAYAAYAAAYAAADAADAASDAASDAAYAAGYAAADLRKLRAATIARSIEVFREAIAMTEEGDKP